MIEDSSQDITNIFKPEDYIPHQNTKVPDDISVITNPLMAKFPEATAQSLMGQSNLKYEYIRVGNNVSCLKYNLFGIFD